MSLKYLKMDKPKPRFRVHREYRVQYRLCGDSRPTLGAILFQHSVNTQAGGPPLRFVQRRDSTAPIQMEFSVRSTKSSICVIVAELCSAWAVQRPAPTWPAAARENSDPQSEVAASNSHSSIWKSRITSTNQLRNELWQNRSY